MKLYMLAGCPYRACEPSLVVNATNTDRERDGSNPWRNRAFISFSLHSEASEVGKGGLGGLGPHSF